MNNFRPVLIGNEWFACPMHIQRCFGDRIRGWQVRYRGTVFFSDGADGPRVSFNKAVRALKRRYKEHPPAPRTSLRRAPLAHKQNDLPAGISGPVLGCRPGRRPYAYFTVSFPVRPGRAREGTTVYIGTQANWSQQRYDMALDKAIKLRTDAVRRFKEMRA
jgi:hypothetical protein